MRNCGAAARAHIYFAAAAGSMQPTHLLDGGRIPDCLQRRAGEIAERSAIQHIALAAGIDIAVLLHVHGAAPEIMARMLPLLGGMACVWTNEVGLILLNAD